ncbi:hypothetical protein BC835DRAFT_1486268, partial [Cytidiella melzeri]
LIQDIPGKGKCVITRQHFSKGNVVFTERPLFTQILTRSNTSVLASLSSCTPIERKHFYSLHNCHRPRKYLRELGIFETNVLPCRSNDAHGHVAQQGGMFLFAARFNASCVPNVNNHWDPECGKVVFRALRDIAPGEELCIGYGKLLATQEERRAEMKRKFWFESQCKGCRFRPSCLLPIGRCCRHNESQSPWRAPSAAVPMSPAHRSS